MALPTVWLCADCHGKTHGRMFPNNHRELTIAGLNAAKAKGKKLGNPHRDGGVVVRAMRHAAYEAAEAAMAAKIAAEKAAIWAAGISNLADEVEKRVAEAVAKLGYDLPYRQALARHASDIKESRAVAKAISINVEIERAKADGHKTLTQVAAELMRRGVKTSTGKSKWTAQQVKRTIWMAAGKPRVVPVQRSYLPKSIKIDRTN